MKNLQEIYKRVQENKKKRRDLNKQFKAELGNVPRYEEVKDELDQLRAEKKSIEQEILSRSGIGEERDQVTADLSTDEEMLSDIALNMYVNEETVEVVDEYEQTWYPRFKVTFKKAN